MSFLQNSASSMMQQAFRGSLTATNIVIGIFSVLVLYFATAAIYNIWFHPLAKFPGPIAAKVSRLWITWQCLIEKEPYVLDELTKKYGPVVRITPTMLHVSNATALPKIYHRTADKSGHYITGSFGPHESLFHMQKHSEHSKHRKLIAGPYTLSAVKAAEPIVDAHTARWISRLDEMFVRSGETFDFALWPVFWAYDIISDVAFGGPFGFIEQGCDASNLIGGYHEGLPLFGVMGRLYPLTNLLKKTPLGKKYLIASPQNDDGIGQIMRFRDDLVRQRLADLEAGKEGRKDLLQHLLDIRGGDGKPLDIEHIKTEAFIIIVAGADTIGTTVQAMIKFIAETPAVYEKVMAEVDEATRAGHFSAIPQLSEVLEHCPYYMACVKEAQRLCPPAPSLFPRLVSAGGIELDGKHVPEGTEVTANPWIVHRDPEIYGEDFESFRPERWLESEEKTKLYQKYQFGFGYGSRSCLGKEFARMELYKGPLQLFRSYRLVLDTSRPAKYHIKGGESWFSDMWMKLEKRDPIV